MEAPPSIDVWEPSPQYRPGNHRPLRVLTGLTAAYVGLGYLVDVLGFAPGMMNVMWFSGAYLVTPVLVLATLPLVLLGRFLAILRTASQLGDLGPVAYARAWGRCRQEVLNRGRLLDVVGVACLMPLMLTAYGAWKGGIPQLVPFWADPLLGSADKMLHLGRAPWVWLHPIAGHPRITAAIDLSYAAWLMLIPGVLTVQCWSTRWETRGRFFIGFTLAWIVLGTGVALVFSSAGPCFVANLGLPHADFDRLLAYLHQVDAQIGLYAVPAQAKLWAGYLGRTEVPWVQISAMPSMHVAIASIYVLAARNAGRLLFAISAAYAVLILVGSIHLGLHYALDGYAAIAGTAFLWWAAERLRQSRSTARHAGTITSLSRERTGQVGNEGPSLPGCGGR